MYQLTYTDSSNYNWNKALPIGNGRLGAMIYGNNTSERFQLNEDSVWFGGPRNRNNKDALAHLEEVRSLILSGNIRKAEALAKKALAELENGNYTYELQYIEMFDNEDYVYTLNIGEELQQQMQTTYDEFANWLGSWEM